jgi:hypothetical protein
MLRSAALAMTTTGMVFGEAEMSAAEMAEKSTAVWHDFTQSVTVDHRSINLSYRSEGYRWTTNTMLS